MSEITDKIIRVLDGVNDQLLRTSANDAEWTARVKTELAKLGKAHGYLVYASNVTEAHGGEWLYDVCWLKYDEDDIVEIGLIVESEWLGGNNILEDFQKLCQSRAQIRLMLFQAAHYQEYMRTLHNLSRQIRKFTLSQPDDRYLLSCWFAPEKKFKHELISGAA